MCFVGLINAALWSPICCLCVIGGRDARIPAYCAVAYAFCASMATSATSSVFGLLAVGLGGLYADLGLVGLGEVGVDAVHHDWVVGHFA